jgi:Mg2+ and Co2+ transporter CorA
MTQAERDGLLARAATSSSTSSAWCTTCAAWSRAPRPRCRSTSRPGNRTNDIMRTLTALTAIFLPLNLIAGIFGMNFASMPLLREPFGFWWPSAAW